MWQISFLRRRGTQSSQPSEGTHSVKSITRLYLSKTKQKALSAVRRINDVRNDLAIDSRFKQAESDYDSPINHIEIKEIIADGDWNNLRVTAIVPWREGEELSCIASTAFGKRFSCKTFVIAKHAIVEPEQGIPCDDGRVLTKLLLTIRIPKQITSYAITLENASCPDICGCFLLRESAYGTMLHENGMLVQSAEYDCSYSEWFSRHKASEAVLRDQRTIEFEDNPIFSIIVPLFKTPIGFFNDMVQSVFDQSYPYWQLVLVNASPDQAELSEAVAAVDAIEERVTVVTLQENLGITLNTNAGIRASIGDFICFFDHDDIIEPDILFEYAKAINEHPTTDALYCDEDKLTPEGEFLHPFLKPDYSPDLLNCHNYICHMLTVRASILAQLEPAGSDVDGAQDYNCVLRVAEKARHIHHVRRVLYHWRISATSVASNSDNKPYAEIAGKIALERHFERIGIDATIEHRREPFKYNAVYRIEENPLVSIIIPSHVDHDMLEACVSSVIEKTTYANYELLIADCGNDPELIMANHGSALSENDRVRIIRPSSEESEISTDSASANTHAASKAQGDYLVFLSPDIRIITPDWLSIMLGYFMREQVGCVGARIMCADGTIFHAGIAIGEQDVLYLNQNSTMSMFSYFGLRDDVLNVSAVSPSCMMTRKNLFRTSGGFNSAYPSEYQGIDYCLRVREAGKLIVYSPFAESCKLEPYPQFGCDDDFAPYAQGIALFKQRWNAYFADADPYHNVNLMQCDPEGRFSHLKRDYDLSVAMGRDGLEYRRSSIQNEE